MKYSFALNRFVSYENFICFHIIYVINCASIAAQEMLLRWFSLVLSDHIPRYWCQNALALPALVTTSTQCAWYACIGRVIRRCHRPNDQVMRRCEAHWVSHWLVSLLLPSLSLSLFLSPSLSPSPHFSFALHLPEEYGSHWLSIFASTRLPLFCDSANKEGLTERSASDYGLPLSESKTFTTKSIFLIYYLASVTKVTKESESEEHL